MKLGNSKSFFAQQLFVALCKGFVQSLCSTKTTIMAQFAVFD